MKAWLRSRRFVPQAHPDGWGTLLRVGALAFVAAAIVAAVTQSRRAEIDVVRPMAIAADPLAADLIRCRTITPEQTRDRRYLPARLGGKPATFLRAVVFPLRRDA